jgi:hypothetical protein
MLARKALAGTAAATKLYVEDVFSTYLYTGNGSTQTITNNIDLSGKGGLVWTKPRNVAQSNQLVDTVRGQASTLFSNSTNPESVNSGASSVSSFSSTGYVAGVDFSDPTRTYVSWTFRKAEKFFDVVTYTGDGTAGRTIAHNLGSVPGCIIVKCTNSPINWPTYHRSITPSTNNILTLNSTNDASLSGITRFGNDSAIVQPTSTVFTLGSAENVNFSGNTYVAYLFAHDAGGFGDAGSDNVISCGSFTSTSGVVSVTLNYEPQWLLIKNTSQIDSWYMYDTMRNLSYTNNSYLRANLSNAEASFGASYVKPTPTGFTWDSTAFGGSGDTYIYIAIRRGPMKTPTTGTSVFGDTYASVEPVSTNLTTESGVLADLVVHGLRISGTSFGRHWMSRLTGNNRYLVSSSTDFETSPGTFWTFDNNNYAYIPPSGYANNNGTGTPYVAYSFKRAPKFFDVVCYTGTGSATTVSHNLSVVPELMIVKNRSNGAPNWQSYHSALGNTQIVQINTTNAASTASTVWNNTTPTSSVFTVGTNAGVNTSSENYVAYLFASLSGVSKVGSYTGNGSSVTVTTDFQPRFILVKRTDSTGDWIFSDSARGLVAGNDPYLELNTQDAEVTNEDWVDISSTSFTVNQTTNNANVNTGTYIYLAIA